MAGWHLDGAWGKSRGSGRAENSSPKSVLQQSCCPFLVEIDFRVIVSVAFYHFILFSLQLSPLQLWNSPHYIYIYQKSQDQTGRVLFSVLYYSFQTMAGWQQTVNPGWQVYSSVNNAQIHVLIYWRLQTCMLFLGYESYLHNQPARAYLQLRESSLQKLGRRGARFMKRHRTVIKRTGGIRQAQFRSALGLLSLPPALCWAEHELGTTMGQAALSVALEKLPGSASRLCLG